MLRPLKKFNAQSTLEYMTLLIVLMAALIVFSKYIMQAFMGRWRATGESFGMGMQFQPGSTLQCRYDSFSNTAMWYNAECYDSACDCHSIMANAVTCRDCILGCAAPDCQPQ